MSKKVQLSQNKDCYILLMLCCGPTTAAGSSLARMTGKFVVGTPIQGNKSDIHGQITLALYSPSPSLQMDRFLPARPRMNLFISGMQLLAFTLYNIYTMVKKCTLFVSLPPVSPWHQQDWTESYVYGGRPG